MLRRIDKIIVPIQPESEKVLIDSSKFGKVQTNYFADIEDFELIITDGGIPDEYISNYKRF